MMKRIFTLGLILLLTSTSLVMAQKDGDTKKLDKKVRADVETRLDDTYEVTDVNFEESYIMVEATDGEVIKRTYYTPIGEFEETITVMSYTTLPRGAKTAFMASNFSHSDIQEVYFVKMLTEEFFAIKLLRQGELRYLFIDAAGEEIDMTKKLLFTTEV